MSTSAPARERQRTVLAILSRAHGEEVTYDELREAGVESPASVISELERAGVPVERCYSGRWLQRASCRLDPGRARARRSEPGAAIEHATEWGPVRVYTSRAAWPLWPTGWHLRLPAWRPRPPVWRLQVPAWRPRVPARRPPAWPELRALRLRPNLSPARLLSALALVAAAITITLLVLDPIDATTPPGAHQGRSAQATNHPAQQPQHTSSRLTQEPSHRLIHRATSRPVSSPPGPIAASALEAHGHALLKAGQYPSAISALRDAIRATGESASACVQPTSQSCQTYAAALYELGQALRVSGDPAAAVPILELRLRIDDDRGAVAQALAQAQVSSPSAPASQLEARGHQLLASGAYGSAIPVLRQAVKASGETPGACAQGTSSRCLIYAFALYDLGRALRLNGDPAAAVPILRERLEINNQRDVVAQELRLAESGSSA